MMRISIKAGSILLIPVIILLIILILRTFSLVYGFKDLLRIIFLAMILVPFILNVFSLFSFSAKSQWMSELRVSSTIYFGFVLAVLAISKDVLATDQTWLDTNLLGLSVAVIGLGWTLLPRKFREPEVIDNQKKTYNENFNEKLENTERRQHEMENIIINSFTKLAEDLKKIK